MKIADITTTGELLRFHIDDPKAVITISNKLRSGSLFLMNDDITAYVSYDPMFGGKWVGHIHGVPQIRGKDLWAFALSTAVWMVDNRAMSHLLCFVKKEDRKLKTFVRLFGMAEVGKVGKEMLYVADDQQILNYASQKQEEEELCQQH